MFDSIGMLHTGPAGGKTLNNLKVQKRTPLILRQNESQKIDPFLDYLDSGRP